MDAFEKEVGFIFEEVYNGYLNHDIRKVEEYCVG